MRESEELFCVWQNEYTPAEDSPAADALSAAFPAATADVPAASAAAPGAEDLVISDRALVEDSGRVSAAFTPGRSSSTMRRDTAAPAVPEEIKRTAASAVASSAAAAPRPARARCS